MENICDWCILCQFWWGYCILVWYYKEIGEVYVDYEVLVDIENWEQDLDVLDIWFSLVLWLFLIMGWLDVDVVDFKCYYLINVFVIGYDIIFFWVFCMIF